MPERPLVQQHGEMIRFGERPGGGGGVHEERTPNKWDAS